RAAQGSASGPPRDCRPVVSTGFALVARALAVAAAGHAIAVLEAEPPRRLLGQGIAVALAVGRAHEGGDDLEIPLADLACLAPQVGEPQVDVELEQIDARRAGRHGTGVKTAPDGPCGGARGAYKNGHSTRLGGQW